MQQKTATHKCSTALSSIINTSEPERVLINKRIVIVNPWDNKFTDLYVRYLQKNNEVRLIKQQIETNLVQALKWADLVWSQWCNEWLAAISKQKHHATLVTHLHSYEILNPQLMKNIEWKRVDGIVFVADHIRKNANRLYRQQINDVPQTTIFNSVDLSEYPLQHVHPGKNIGYVGFINHKKGIGLLLQCMKGAIDFDPEFRFHIAGSFQDTRFEVYVLHMIEQMGLKENVLFYGWVKNVPEWLKSMNYIISTSPWEGCPLNIIEAMACGVKPLIHNWQGAKTLFPAKFVFNTIHEFLNLIKDPEYDSNEYRRIVDKVFNAEHNIPMIEKFLGNCMNSRIKKQIEDSFRTTQITKSSKVMDNNELNFRKAEKCSVEAWNSQKINFFQPLTRTIELSSDRKDFTVEFCRGKRVLHIGCVDSGLMDERIKSNSHLHYQIAKVATNVIGADIEEIGIKRLSKEGFEVYRLDIEKDSKTLNDLSKQVDVIVIPEVIEHLNNAGKALYNLKSCSFKGDILISTPNAFSFRAFRMLSNCIELIHPDHNYYYSPTTLKTILTKHGFFIERLIMYYWQTDDAIGKQLQKIVTSCPYYAEGMIAIVKDISFGTSIYN